MLETDIDTEYAVRNGRKRLRGRDDVEQSAGGGPLPLMNNSGSGQVGRPSQHPLTPGGSVARFQPLRRPGSGGDHHESNSPDMIYEDEQYSTNDYSPNATLVDTGVDDQHLTAEKLLHTEVYSGHDALNLLFEAAGRSGDIVRAREDDEATTTTTKTSSVQQGPLSASRPLHVGTAVDDRAHQPYVRQPNVNEEEAEEDEEEEEEEEEKEEEEEEVGGGGKANDDSHMPIDPAIRNANPFPSPTTPAIPANQNVNAEQVALRAWSSCRFVRAGWFTAREAMAYLA